MQLCSPLTFLSKLPFDNILLTLEFIASFVFFNIYFPNLDSFHQSIFIFLYSNENNIDCKLLITKSKYQKPEAKNPILN